jgi:hypothetical protein
MYDGFTAPPWLPSCLYEKRHYALKQELRFIHGVTTACCSRNYHTSSAQCWLARLAVDRQHKALFLGGLNQSTDGNAPSRNYDAIQRNWFSGNNPEAPVCNKSSRYWLKLAGCRVGSRIGATAARFLLRAARGAAGFCFGGDGSGGSSADGGRIY